MGRAGRSPEIEARAILLVEKSMFKRKKIRKPGGKQTKVECDEILASQSQDSGSEHGSDIDSSDEVGEDGDGKEWGKKVEESLRMWIEAMTCRRDIADEYFDNPPRQNREHLPFNSCL